MLGEDQREVRRHKGLTFTGPGGSHQEDASLRDSRINLKGGVDGTDRFGRDAILVLPSQQRAVGPDGIGDAGDGADEREAQG